MTIIRGIIGPDFYQKIIVHPGINQQTLINIINRFFYCHNMINHISNTLTIIISACLKLNNLPFGTDDSRIP